VTTTDRPVPEEHDERLMRVFDLIGPLYRRVVRKLEQDDTPPGLPVGVRAVLDLLRGAGPMTVPRMGRVLSLSRQFVQRTVNDAAERKLVEIRPNPAHQRSPLIGISEEGRAALAAVADREREVLRRIGADLTDDEIGACVRVLSHLLEAFQEGDADR
jgi:DNA-binding MarR family transcriptional regulator